MLFIPCWVGIATLFHAGFMRAWRYTAGPGLYEFGAALIGMNATDDVGMNAARGSGLIHRLLVRSFIDVCATFDGRRKAPRRMSRGFLSHAPRLRAGGSPRLSSVFDAGIFTHVGG